MARWFIISLAVAIFCICVIQAVPLQEETTANKVDDIWAKTAEKFNKGIEAVMNDPQINDFLKETGKFFENAAGKIKEGAEKFIPKTDETTEER